MKGIKRIVVKIGSNLVSQERVIASVVEQIAELKKSEVEVILVSSGAIVSGIKEYGLSKRPKKIFEKQAYASIGQPLLMKLYIEGFKKYDIKVAQVLLTREDFENRGRYLNIRNTMEYLLKIGIVPIVNENDTVSAEEIKLGDNDTLSALVASKLSANMLIILTDVDGLYDKNPREFSDAKIIHEVKDTCVISQFLGSKGVAKTGFFGGTGGMKTKLDAARIACSSGIETVIANGLKENVILDVYSGDRSVGTRFCPLKFEMNARERWIAFGKKVKGRVIIDEGAVVAVKEKNKSLLPSGVKFVEGNFKEKDVVSVVDEKGIEIGRGIVNFDCNMLKEIIGKKTSKIREIFPDVKVEEVIHKNDLVIL